VRYNGLVGGGPEHSTGVRPKLLQNLEHTLGVNAVIAGLYRAAQARRANGHDDAVLEWRNSGSCSSRIIRPDGYAVYRYDSAPLGFSLEFDRGTMSIKQYYAKFAAYYTYLERGLCKRDYDGMPTVLVVTTESAVEKRIACAVQAVSTGRDIELTVLYTTKWRYHDFGNLTGLLGSV
jgi:hypothetical protein